MWLVCVYGVYVLGLGATCTLERGLAGVRAAGGGCPLWVPPAGSPVRFIYLAPVLLHPRLIEARRSGAERISGGLERVHTSEAQAEARASARLNRCSSSA